MALETFFQHEILTGFAYPFLLIFFLIFAILEKTKILGDDKKQIDALVSFVIALIFISALEPKLIVGNMILFLTVALVVMFVALLLWGFVSGGSLKEKIIEETALKWVVGIGIIIAVVLALLFATGLQDNVANLLFRQSWSGAFWTNISFMVVVAIALALVLKGDK